MKKILFCLVILLGVGEMQAQRNGFVPTVMEPSAPALMEFLGVVAPDSIDLFLVEDLPAVLNGSTPIAAPMQWAERISPDAVTMWRSRSRYLTYLKINEQYYGYFVDPKRMKAALSTLFLGMPMTTALLASNNVGVSSLQLAIDCQLCIYDTETGVMQVQHPFMFVTTQPKKEGRDLQIMQPDFIPVEYPLADDLQRAIAAEYMKICREYGYISKGK